MVKYTYKKMGLGPRPHIVFEDGKARANFSSKKGAKSFIRKIKL